ncbi:MAG: S-layer homology domain-containing protein [Clostridiales bacterium]|nr:S-layer homology domain-containing protein [Clostridiales bacterium]
MSSKELLRSLLVFVCAALVLVVSAFALEGAFPNVAPLPETSPEPTPEETPEPEPEYVCPLELKTGNITHSRYISGYDDGSFQPDKTVTRAEAAAMIYGLLSEVPEQRAEFADVSPEDWYYDAIGVLAACGIIVDEDGNVEPGAEISRGEFVAMLSRFFPETEAGQAFPDVTPENEYYEHIAKAGELGWISGYDDGLFYPERTITRAEATAVINNVLGRTADASYADGIILPLFKDVSPDHWAYYDIMEAALTHSPTMIHGVDESWHYVDTEPLRRPSGVLYDGTDYYYIAEDTGLPVADAYVGTLYFGADGHYTSGDAEIDEYAKEILAEICTDGMTQEERLRAAYDYTRDSFTYLRRNYYENGDTGWEMEEARTMFRTRRGNCYCYAAVFWALARQLGYDARVISGDVGWSARPHGWVEIDFDGVPYIYDTELEMSYRKKNVFYYNFYHMHYDNVPWPYTK